jgi:hypothetical protein
VLCIPLAVAGSRFASNLFFSLMHKPEMQFLNRDTLVFLADDPTAADRIKILFWFQRCLFLLVSAGVTSSS